MDKASLPKWVEKMIVFCCPDQLQEQILGDLEEYYYDAYTSGRYKASLVIAVQAIKFLHPYILFKRKSSLNSNSMGLIKNYIKASRRNLLRNPLHTSINILGLTIGITTCLTIFTILQHDYSFNKNHPDKERIYRVYTGFSGAFSGTNKGVPVPLGEHIEENFTGVQGTAHFHTYSAKVEIPEADAALKDLGSQNDLIFASPDYFEITPYTWIVGSKSVLDRPHTVVLIESQARKYFGEAPFEELIGQSVIYRDSLEMEVGGIIKDLAYKTDFAFTDILSYATINSSWLKETFNSDWGSTNSASQLFIKLNPETTEESVLTQLVQTATTNNEKDEDWKVDYLLQPLSDLHFNQELNAFDNTSYTVDPSVLKVLSIVAIAILLIAIINFVNLETALSIERASEVGVRKVLGSTKSQLIVQFLNESYLVTFIAFAISIPLVNISLSLFAEFTPTGLQFEFFSLESILQLIAGFILIGALAGIYPSVVLSSISTQKSLNSKVGKHSKKGFSFGIRKILTVFQFGFSQVLIVLTVVAAMQVNYMLDKDLGFSSDGILYFYTPPHEEDSKKEVLINKLQAIAGIEEKSVFNNPPIQNGWSSSVTKFINDDGDELVNSVFLKSGDSSYISFFDMTLEAGRMAKMSSTTKEVVINETFATILGFDDYSSLLGKQLFRNKDTLTIVGVLKDIHFMSLHHPIEPMEITLNSDGRGFGIKMTDNSDSHEVIANVEKAYKSVYPDQPFNTLFMEDTKETFYKTESQTIKLATTSMLIAIVISCLGLFGLASFATAQRTKEIGIRKVLGSSVQNIVGLLTSEFLKYIVLAFLLAVPVSYFLGKQWLEDFAYSISINPLVFIGTGLTTWIIAFLTVSYKSIQAAIKNPVDSLRYE